MVTSISLHFLIYLVLSMAWSTTSLPSETLTSTSRMGILKSLLALSLPQTTSPEQLPIANTTLLHVTLGHGIQNYTCATSTSEPVAVGALATLYDVSTYSQAEIIAMPPIAAYLSLPTSPSTPLTVSSPLRIVAGSATMLSVLGYHYFGADGTPTFNLTESETKQSLYAKKVGDVSAPIDASPGGNGMGAVDWLYLSNKGGSEGLGSVYRVVTAGGEASVSCEGEGDGSVLTVPYAALYWFYQ